LREFSETQAKEIFKKSQSDGETGLTFFYKIIQLHARSKLNLDEKQLVTLIVAHMNPLYKSKFQDKVYDSLDKLKDDLKRYDKKRGALLAEAARKQRKVDVSALELEAKQHGKRAKRRHSSDSDESDDDDMEELRTHLHALEKRQKHEHTKQKLMTKVLALQTSLGGPVGPAYAKPWTEPGWQTPTWQSYSQNSQTNYQQRGGFRGRGRFRGFGRGRGGRGNFGNHDSRQDKRNIQCHHCFKYGHYARECRSRLAGQAIGPSAAPAIEQGPSNQPQNSQQQQGNRRRQ
jgi:hypothetical protein